MHPASASPAPQIPPQTPLQMPSGQPLSGMTMEAVLQNYPNAQVTIPASVAAMLLASYSHGQQQGMPLPFGQMSQMPNQMPMPMLQGQGFPPPGMASFLPPGALPPGGILPQAGFPQSMMGLPLSQPMGFQPPPQAQFPGSASPDMHGRRNSSVSGVLCMCVWPASL